MALDLSEPLSLIWTFQSLQDSVSRARGAVRCKLIDRRNTMFALGIAVGGLRCEEIPAP